MADMVIMGDGICNNCAMTRISHVILSVAVIICLAVSGCTSGKTSGPAPPVSATGTPAAACTAAISSDPSNCGGCGNACPANAVCDSGQCTCRDGFRTENGRCVVVLTGTPSASGCPAGMSLCPNGYCYELASSPENCGACGNRCLAGMVCINGACTSLAPVSTTLPVAATPTATVPAAVTSITPQKTAVSGISVNPGINTGLSGLAQNKIECRGKCIDDLSDPANCGACGNVCNKTAPDCCNGVCVDTNIDSTNCGYCAHACDASAPRCCTGRCLKFVSGAMVCN